MKKTITWLTLALALIMAMSSISIPALAASKCPDHPNAKVTEIIGSGSIAPFSVIRHIESRPVDYVCSVCNKHLDSGTKASYGFHSFSSSNGGICSVCSWQRPTRDDLKTEAWGLVSDIDERSGWALYPGDLYSTAGGTDKVGTLSTNQELRIIEHADVGGVIWVRVCNRIDINNPIGWACSELISISPGELVAPPPEGSLIGRTVRITVSSGRARNGAGDYPVVEYVRLGEKYYVNDQTTGTDGKEWIQINVDGKDLWISSGIVEIVN